MNRIGLGAAALVLALAGRARAEAVRVEVFRDADGDGARAAGEVGIAGAVVAFGTRRFAVTGADGVATMDLPAGIPGAIWVRVPDGYTPGPAWTWWPGSGARATVALRPLDEPIAVPLRFVVVSDTHLTAAQPFAIDLAAVVRDAVALPQPPAFLALLGDITQGGQLAQFDLAAAQLDGLGVPPVPVPGNHDWYDQGAAWMKRHGPDNYSFDAGGVHFVVWNMALPDDEAGAFLAADLARVPAAMPAIAMSHAPPSPALAAALRELGVVGVLTGHLHGNRSVEHEELRELSTEPLLMGGIDATPAGYRIVTVSGRRMTSEHRTVVDAPFVALTSPGAGQCVAPGAAFEVLAATSAPAVEARVDCSTPVALRAAGGWAFRGTLPALAPGAHRLTLDGGRTTATIVSCAEPARPARSGLVPPLVTRWTATAGGHVLSATPQLAGGLAYIVTTDLADGDAGGVTALDIATGALRWRVLTEHAVRGAVALSGDTVVVAQIDGAILGLDAATGAERWRTDVSDGVPPPAGAVFAGPTADDGDILVGGQRRFAALDAATGHERWVVDPIPAAPPWVDFAVLAPVAVARGLAIGTFAREQSGLAAFDRATGALAWRVDESSVQPASPAGSVDTLAIGIAAAPVVAGDAVFVATGADEVAALDVDTGAVRWRTSLDPRGFDWGAAILGTPAYADGILVVPTLYDDLVALDAASGAVRWRHAAPAPGVLRVTHYRGAGEAGYAAAPAIAGGIVWAASTDGTLVALALATGDELWHAPLGVPVLAGVAVAGDTVLVASFDGSVRALSPGTPAVPADAPRCEAPRAGGCCDAGAPGSSAALAAVIYACTRRRRRTTPNSSATPIGHAARPPASHA